MKIDWWTLALQAVNAAVLIWLLAHFLFRPVADIIAARQKAAQQLLADASAAKAAAQSEREKAKAENEKLAEHRSEALKAVEAEAATEKAALLAAAQAEADKLRAAAEAALRSTLPASFSTECRVNCGSPPSSMASRPGLPSCRTERGPLSVPMGRRSELLLPAH